MPHFKFNSDINGTGGLQRFLYNYEGWLDKLQEDYTSVSFRLFRRRDPRTLVFRGVLRSLCVVRTDLV